MAECTDLQSTLNAATSGLSEADLAAKTLEIANRRYELELAEYNGWRDDHKKKVLMAAFLMMGCFVLAFIGRSMDPQSGLGGIIILLSVVGQISGEVWLLQLKGQHWALFVLTPLIVLVIPDKNKRLPPARPFTGAKPEGSVFSDW